MNTALNHKIRPTYSGAFGHGWTSMSKYFLIYLLVVFIMGIVQFPMGFTNINIDGEFIEKLSREIHFFDYYDFERMDNLILSLGMFSVLLGIFALAYKLLVIPVFNYGAKLIFVHGVRGIRPQFETLVKGFKDNYLHIVLANLLVGALVAIGTIFFIIPGIIIGCRLAFTSYVVMDKKLDPILAVEESWRMTKGHGWTIFFMGITAFFVFILGLIMCFVGVFPAIIWVKSSFAGLYEAVNTENETVESGQE